MATCQGVRVPGLKISELLPPPQPPTLGFALPDEPSPIEKTAAVAPPPATLPKPRELSPYLDQMVEPELKLDLVVGISRLLVFKESPKKLQLGGDDKNEIASLLIVSEKEVSITGRKPGRTVLNVWFPDPANPAKLKIVSWLVQISPDDLAIQGAQNYLGIYAKNFEAQINHAFPDSKICLSIVGPNLLVSGQARDIAEATQILTIVGGNRQQGGGGQGGNTTSIVQQGLAQTRIDTFKQDDNVNPDDAPGNDPNRPLIGALGRFRVINLIRVPGEQQVMLKVTVAEMNRSALRSMGVDFSVSNGMGITVFQNRTGGVQANLPTILDNGKIVLAIEALKTRNLAKLLAQPNVVAINGQTAGFSVGGQFPVPVVTGFTAAGLQGVQFVPFGVQLNFRPTITDKDRIRLVMSTVVSARNDLGGATVNGTVVPGLDSREFNTTVEMREGQTFAIAGLIQHKYSAGSRKIPFIGELPLIGNLTGKATTAADELELIVLVSPALVHPVGPNQWRPMPGAGVLEPSDAEFYLHGRTESHHPIDYRSPVRTDLQRTLEYRDQLPPPQRHLQKQP